MNDRLDSPFLRSLSENVFPFGLGSDNHSGAHPRFLAALAAVNSGFAPSYGTDPVTEEAVKVFREHFGSETHVHFCFNGTAANVLSLAPLLRPHHTVLCSEFAHIHVDECSAPERLLGLKLHAISLPKGATKLTPELLRPYLIRKGDQHFSQVKAISITQPTEYGTVYSPDELAHLVQFCREHDLWLHIDGARLVNAAVSINLSLAEVTKGADVVSFGGTKNGLVFGEAVLFLSAKAREHAKDFAYIRKQLMQLPSKTRFISAQFVEFLGTPLWKEIAEHACARAKELRSGLEKLPAPLVSFTHPTEANAVFAIFDRRLEKTLKKNAFFYVWNEATREVRLMTSWNTPPAAIESFIACAQEFKKQASTGGDLP
ncbi:MAG: beta-eliminating lyase-related protein [Bdellovibrionales bacterium]|jgi:threonine aldolase|nr:beta-eliminating lyase-related protein [Bdellovibrionales bacterium]